MTHTTFRLDQFIGIYGSALEYAVREHLDEYTWPLSQVPTVIARMRVAIERRSYNKDGYAFRTTCESLNIPHTYKAINTWLSEE